MILTPNTMMPMTALNFLSPDGKCFTFDARANGYGRGEGIGVVVLKRLQDALRDNDTIRAVIRATRVNQDGHTTGKPSLSTLFSPYEAANDEKASLSPARKPRSQTSPQSMSLPASTSIRLPTSNVMAQGRRLEIGESSRPFPSRWPL